MNQVIYQDVLDCAEETVDDPSWDFCWTNLLEPLDGSPPVRLPYGSKSHPELFGMSEDQSAE